MFFDQYVDPYDRLEERAKRIIACDTFINDKKSISQEELYKYCGNRESEINRFIDQINDEFKEPTLSMGDKERYLQNLILPLYKKARWICRHTSEKWKPESRYAKEMQSKEEEINSLIKALKKLNPEFYHEVVQDNATYCFNKGYTISEYQSLIEAIDRIKGHHPHNDIFKLS